jgi:hypothetical protein
MTTDPGYVSTVIAGDGTTYTSTIVVDEDTARDFADDHADDNGVTVGYQEADE